MPNQFANAGPGAEGIQDSITLAANTTTALSAHSVLVNQVVVQPGDTNVAPLKVGYGHSATAPVFTATIASPFILPVIRGKTYDLAKLFARSTNAGDKANYAAQR